MVDAQRTALEIHAVQLVDGVLGALLVGELHEAESLRAVGLAVVDDAENAGMSYEKLSCSALLRNEKRCESTYRTLVTCPTEEK